MHHFSIASADSWMKGTLYDATKLRFLQPDASVMIKDFVNRSGLMIVNERSTVANCGPVAVSDATKTAAHDAIHPPSIPSEIQEIKTTAIGGKLWTVKAVITQVSSFSCIAMFSHYTFQDTHLQTTSILN